MNQSPSVCFCVENPIHVQKTEAPMKFTQCLSWATLLCVATAFSLSQIPTAEAQTYTVLHTFTGRNDGAHPLAGLTVDSSGNLYGATYDAGGHGLGNVYQLAPVGSQWTFSPLYAFQGSDSYDGAAPTSRPVFGPDGHLYGTTLLGGLGSGCLAWYNGCGTVYSLSNSSGTWSESVLFQFGTSNGGYPGYGDLVFDQMGNLYDTSPTSGSDAEGIAFELTRAANWAPSALYNFQGTPDGAAPLNGPIIDRAGNLYGTTSVGGANGYGTVYKLAPSGTGSTRNILYNFENRSDGGTPVSNLVMDRFGNLYGATQAGGNYGGGTVFRLLHSSTGAWLFSTIYQFQSRTSAPRSHVTTSGCSGQPFTGSDRTLAIDNRGNLYGTTSADAANQWGAVFRLSPVAAVSWSYTVLHGFNGADGSAPWGRLALDSAGNLYGTAVLGGANNCGVVFQITP